MRDRIEEKTFFFSRFGRGGPKNLETIALRSIIVSDNDIIKSCFFMPMSPTSKLRNFSDNDIPASLLLR